MQMGSVKARMDRSIIQNLSSPGATMPQIDWINRTELTVQLDACVNRLSEAGNYVLISAYPGIPNTVNHASKLSV